jgi:uncharacterized repeat protein (TIGR03806 family)
MKLSRLCIALSLLLFACNNDDDIFVEQCAIPTNLTESNITYNSVTLNWEDSNEAPSFRIQYGLSGFTIGSGNSFTVDENSSLISSLTPNTTYDYYVEALCDSNNSSMLTSVRSFTTLPEPVIPEFRQNLSEMNLFAGDLDKLQPSIYAFEYKLNTALFTDYAHKQRLIALPQGSTMTFNGNGFPNFPDNTVIAKTFFYNIDDRDENLGKNIIETRILIKINGAWETGDYRWNEDQSDAVLDLDGGTVPVTWIDTDGNPNNVTYKIPSNTDCFTCHQTNNNITPIGPKLRTLNFDINGVNQLQKLADLNMLNGLSSPSDVTVLPNWEDQSFSLSERTRAYLDVNCAHCHSPGGFCEEIPMDLRYETPFENSGIYDLRYGIMGFTSFYINGVSMPLIGTTMVHDEGYALIEEYVNSL